MRHPVGREGCDRSLEGHRLYQKVQLQWECHPLINLSEPRLWQPIVFLHPTKEPWRFIGLVLQLRGKMVRKENSWFRKHYPGYGHNKEQGEEAMEKGKQVAKVLLAEE